MTIERAKLYKTAQVTTDKGCSIPEGFTYGDFVALTFLRKTSGECVFQCRNTNGTIAAISEYSLERFVF